MKSEKGVFLVRKGSYMTYNIVKKPFNIVKKGKILKTWSITKKVIRNFCRESGHFFPKITSFRNLGPRKNFPSPQTRRQVSATALECITLLVWFSFATDYN